MYLSLAESPDMINVDLLADKASGADSASAALYSAMGRKCADSSPDMARSLLTRAYMIYAMKYGSDSRLAGETKAALTRQEKCAIMFVMNSDPKPRCA